MIKKLFVSDISLLNNQWDFSKNEFTPEKYVVGSSKKAWWICEKNHSYYSEIRFRYNRNYGCPYCKNKKIDNNNSLSTLFPCLMSEWDFNKNILNPNTISTGSTQKVYWKCTNNHSWKSSITKRTGLKTGCPYCSGRKVCNENSFYNNVNSEILKEWNYNKNIKTPHDYTKYSHYKVWWICEKNHEWQAALNNRAKNRGCPTCCESKGEQFIRQFLIKNNINFISQKRFKDCKHKRQLPFDFYIPSINLCIEYNGIQHYENNYFNSKSKNSLELSQYKDKIKKEYCKLNNIKLLIISYQENIEEILNNYFNI